MSRPCSECPTDQLFCRTRVHEIHRSPAVTAMSPPLRRGLRHLRHCPGQPLNTWFNADLRHGTAGQDRGQPVEFTWRLFHAVAARLHFRPRVPARAIFSGVAVAQGRGSRGMPALGSYSVNLSRCCVIRGTDICRIAMASGRASRPPMVVRIGAVHYPQWSVTGHRGTAAAAPWPIRVNRLATRSYFKRCSRGGNSTGQPTPSRLAHSRASLPGAGMRLPDGISEPSIGRELPFRDPAQHPDPRIGVGQHAPLA